MLESLFETITLVDLLPTCISALYVNKINPTAWQDVNLVESFGFLSMLNCSSLPARSYSKDKLINCIQRNAGPAI